MNCKNTVFERFKAHNLRLTRSRIALVERLIDAGAPLCYDDIKELAMDKTTFYRNMHTFEASGLIRRIESDDKKWYFELAGTLHAHFICSACHRVECLDSFRHPSLPGYVIESATYKGTCPECAKTLRLPADRA